MSSVRAKPVGGAANRLEPTFEETQLHWSAPLGTLRRPRQGLRSGMKFARSLKRGTEDESPEGHLGLYGFGRITCEIFGMDVPSSPVGRNIVAVAAASLFPIPAAAQIPVGGPHGRRSRSASEWRRGRTGQLPRPAERAALAGQADLEPVAIAATGVDGRFLLSAPEPGIWKVRVRARVAVAVDRAQRVPASGVEEIASTEASRSPGSE